MKNYLLLIPFVVMQFMASAQNVGIGTSNPVYKLDVRNGSINVDSVYRIGSITVLSIPGAGNLFVGKNAGRVNTGTGNTFNGDQAGYSNTTGHYNSHFGYEAGYSNTSAEANSFFGHSAGKANTTGQDNSFFGRSAGTANTTGNSNSFFGRTAGYSNTSGSFNAFFGHDAGAFTNSGFYNSFFGQTSGYNNTSGSFNAFFGYSAGYGNTMGQDNSFFGWKTGAANNSGHSNSFFGFFAGSDNTTGTYNTAIGKGTYVGSTLINVTAIGAGAVGDDDDKVRIGDMIVGSIGGQVGWSTFSDGRFKQQIQEDIQGLAFIKKLRAVSYVIDLPGLNNYYSNLRSHSPEDTSSRNSKRHAEIALRQTGFIAQEVEHVANELDFSFSGVDAPGKEGALYGLRYGDFVVPLVKAVQEQQVMIEKQSELIGELKATVEFLVKEMSAMKEKGL